MSVTESERVSADLEALLRQYLTRRITDLDREDQERAEQAQRAAVHNKVVEMGTLLGLIVAYSLIVGLISSSALGSALLNPTAIHQRLDSINGFIAGIPDYLRGILLSLVSAGFLLVLRAASLKARTAVGGSVFVGLAALSLMGLSAAPSTGLVGTLVALPGFIAVTILLRQFLRFLERMPGAVPAVALENRSWSRRSALGRRLAQQLDRLHDAVLPALDARIAGLFVAVPVAAAVFVFLAAAMNVRSGFFYWASWVSQVAFLVWCVWACSATPEAVRIPLWSAPVTGALLLTLFGYGPVAVVYALVLLLVFLANVYLAVPLHSR